MRFTEATLPKAPPKEKPLTKSEQEEKAILTETHTNNRIGKLLTK